MLLILAGWSTKPTSLSCAASLPVICSFSDALLPGLLDDPKNFSLYWISRLVNRKTYYYRHPSTISIASGKRQLIRAANWRDRQSPLCTLLPPAFSFLSTKERRGHTWRCQPVLGDGEPLPLQAQQRLFCTAEGSRCSLRVYEHNI